MTTASRSEGPAAGSRLTPDLVGIELRTVTVVVHPRRVRAFARAIGLAAEGDEDERGGRAALPPPVVAPTFPVTWIMEREVVLELLDELGIDRHRMLHAEQSFLYLRPVLAGDVVTCFSRVVEVADKKGGALQFLKVTTRVLNGAGQLACEMTSNTAVRAALDAPPSSGEREGA